MFHGTDNRLSFTRRPKETTLGRQGRARLDRCHCRYPVALCAKLRKYLRGRPELVGGQIEEVSVDQIGCLALKELQSRTTIIQNAAP
jgi:hypothetical protein